MDFWKIVLLIFFVVLSLFLVEFVKNNNKKKQEIIRKVPHMLIGVILAISPLYMTKKEILISALILFLGVWIGKYSPFFKNIFSIKRITYGMWITPISFSLLAFLWLPENINSFIFGMLILAFSDALASLIGVHWGKPKWFLMNKSWAGSFAFFLTTVFLFYIFPEKNITFQHNILASAFLTIIEIFSIFGLDNITVPFFASLLFSIL